MKDLGLMPRLGGLAQTWRDFPLSRKIHYEASGMVDYKSVSTPMEKLSCSDVGLVLANPTKYRQLLGALMFLVNTSADVCCAVNTLSRHMVDHNIHWVGAKKLLRYL